MLGSAIEQYDFNQIFDYISTLQEFMQADKRGLPQYITEPSGYDNKEEAFISTVTYDGIILGCGYGANSKDCLLYTSVCYHNISLTFSAWSF